MKPKHKPKKTAEELLAEITEQNEKYFREHKRKLRQLQEDNEESEYPPEPWYED